MRMVGRRDASAAIQLKLAEQKFVTIVGAGGIGKSTVAIAIAHEMRPIFDGQIRLLDLSPLVDASLIAPVVANCLAWRCKHATSCRP
jgi:predicted ATPase